MNKLILILFTGVFLLTACSGVNKISFGKKCLVEDNHVVYSYVWLYQDVLPADKTFCEDNGFAVCQTGPFSLVSLFQ